MKVLFIIPEIKSMFGTEKGIPIHPHVGIAYLTAVLKQNHHQVKIIDCGVENDWSEQIKKTIFTFKPNLIGITGFSYAYKFLYQTIKEVQSLTSIPILLGGPHVSATKDKILQETKVNYAMYGESETSFLILLNQLSQTKPDLSQVPNLIWKKQKQIIVNPPAPPIYQLDDIPFPDYQSFNLPKYPCYESKIIPLITSRGCPYGCNYCSVRLSMGQNFRPRSPQNVIKEIKYWYKRGFTNFDFNDDCFTLDINRAETICNLIIKNHLKIKFQLYNGIRVNNISLKLLQKMKRAGCYFIAYGCESGNQKTLDRIKKNITLDQVVKTVNLTRKAKIHHAVNFIIGHQDETYPDALDTLKFAKNLQCDYVNFYNLVPYPGTEVYDWAIKKAKFLYPKKDYLKEISYRDINPIFETKEFTKNQRIKVMKQGFRLYEKKLYQFKFGKIIGYIFFSITRIKIIGILTRKIIYSNQKVRNIFNKLTAKSRL